MNKILNVALAAVSASRLGVVEAGGGGESKKVPFCKKEYDVDTGALSFTFGNGHVIEANMNDFPAEMRTQLGLHGASQKIGDSFAGAKGNFAEGIQSAQDVIDQLKAGVWRSSGGEGESRPRLGELAEAISRIKQVPLDKAMAAVEKASDDQRKTWRSNAKVKAVIAQIRSENAAKALEAAGETELAVDIET